MIKIKNISSATVTIVSKDLNAHRSLNPGREIPVEQSFYDELCFDPGFQTLVKSGFLKVTGVDETTSEVIEVNENQIYSREEIKKILEAEDITTFASIIKNASSATKESIVDLAIEMRLTKPAFSTLIKKYCGVDLINAIAAL